jgi:hypothetical protein
VLCDIKVLCWTVHFVVICWTVHFFVICWTVHFVVIFTVTGQFATLSIVVKDGGTFRLKSSELGRTSDSIKDWNFVVTCFMRHRIMG